MQKKKRKRSNQEEKRNKKYLIKNRKGNIGLFHLLLSSLLDFVSLIFIGYLVVYLTLFFSFPLVDSQDHREKKPSSEFYVLVGSCSAHDKLTARVYCRANFFFFYFTFLYFHLRHLSIKVLQFSFCLADSESVLWPVVFGYFNNGFFCLLTICLLLLFIIFLLLFIFVHLQELDFFIN